jgi:hypothetical protein
VRFFCMSSPSSLYAAILAFSVVFAGFSILIVSTPVGYPFDTVWDHGLIRDVVFDGGDYRVLEVISARFVYLNPTDHDVSFNLTYPARYYRYLNGYPDGWGPVYNGRGDNGTIVTVPPGGEYVVDGMGTKVTVEGWFEVEWNGIRRGIGVGPGDLIPRMVMDKQVYNQYENVYVTFEYYNPRAYPVSFRPPSHVEFGVEYNGVKEDAGAGAYIDWISANFTVPPGSTFKIMTFYFKTPEAGQLTLTGMGASKTFIVLPVER